MTTMGAKANFRSTTSCKIAAAAMVLTIAAVAPLLVSTGYAVKAPVPHSWSPWDREARLSSAKSGAAGSATLLLPTTTMSAAVCKMKRSLQ
ncbi:hypothetical protein PVAP13_8KG388745 [Panicum virgatum]|uniref:Uncharacterized protein n=1 Tax=Panicum virgatum TaxID=38727 RepID=A0A8T0PUK0_PANVG|nr:hypothetical protein PVAP13_8KG388745 [Panicum virgatum]